MGKKPYDEICPPLHHKLVYNEDGLIGRYSSTACVCQGEGGKRLGVVASLVAEHVCQRASRAPSPVSNHPQGTLSWGAGRSGRQ